MASSGILPIFAISSGSGTVTVTFETTGPVVRRDPRPGAAARTVTVPVVARLAARPAAVTRPVPPHEVGLEHERLELVVGDDVLEVADLAHEGVRLGVPRP